MRIWILAAAAAGASTAAAAAEPAKWNIDYEDSGCALYQLEGSARTGLTFRRTPGNSLTMINLAGPDWRKVSPKRAKGMTVSVDPGGDLEGDMFFSPAGLQGPVLALKVPEPAFPERLANATSLTLHEGKRPARTFTLRDIKKAVAALRECETDGMRRWGIDPAAWFALRSPPQPVATPASVVRDDDYPLEAVRNGFTGKVIVRLTVDASGRAVKCAPVGTSGHVILDQQTCAIFLRRLKFQPAVNVAGQAVPAPYVTALTWLLPS
jgi:TonB family protein